MMPCIGLCIHKGLGVYKRTRRLSFDKITCKSKGCCRKTNQRHTISEFSFDDVNCFKQIWYIFNWLKSSYILYITKRTDWILDNRSYIFNYFQINPSTQKRNHNISIENRSINS